MRTLASARDLPSEERPEGRPLLEVMSKGPLSVPTAVEYGIQLVEALAAIHEKGLVHGDLNPKTVLVGTDGRLTIVNAARSASIGGRPTIGSRRRVDIAVEVTVPEVGCMSPERIRGELVDHRSDIFSLGVLLQEMLTGAPAFGGSTVVDRMGGILKQKPAELQHGPDAFPPSLVATVSRCLEKAPELRFQTARDVASALTTPMPAGTQAAARTIPSAVAARSGVLTRLQYRLLRHFWPTDPPAMMTALAYEGKSKLDVLFGFKFDDVRGKTVIDFGCGYGIEAIELAKRGAARVIGVDNDLDYLAVARHAAKAAGVSDRIEFSPTTSATADVILSLDAFEHFADPKGMLQMMAGLLRPGGVMMVCFGPPWFHPLGGHLFSVFPWAHLLFSERAFLRWREDRRDERGDSFLAVGLNKMTVRRFERLLEGSRFRVEFLDVVPVRRLKRFHNRVTREFFTSVVRCKLRLPVDEPAMSGLSTRSRAGAERQAVSH